MKAEATQLDQMANPSRITELFDDHEHAVYRRSDRVFAWLMGVQWLAGIALALVYSPYAWAGKIQTTHIHVSYAIFLGAALSAPSILLALYRPAWSLTRHTIAVTQMLWSALLIHLTGGRIETHFHVFGSLAFLAFYRDWKVLISATVVVAADHLLRGLFWPESVYGINNPEWWRFLEHAFWVLFEDVVLIMGIAKLREEMRALALRQAQTEAIYETVERRVDERTRELESSRQQYRSLLETTRTIPWELDATLVRYLYVGPQGEALLGCTVERWLEPDFWPRRVHPEDFARVMAAYRLVADEECDQELEFRLRRDDDRWVWVRSIASPARQGDARGVRGVLLNITERRQLEGELQQAQKLESVGRLASGIAHEINTPIQFVSDSISFVQQAFGDSISLLDRYRSSARSGASDPATEAERLARLDAADKDADIEYVIENVPKALDRSIDGLARVAALVRSMKEFAHPDQVERSPIDINHALSTTLTIAGNEYKYVADLATDFGDLPPVYGRPNELNQVFLNVIVNASQAIGDAVEGTRERGTIRVVTRRDGEQVVISISDSGRGIPEGIRSKIFDPFFTTKPVGRGTGQGLAIARNVVVDKHGGELTFETESGAGTTFFIRLPIGVPAVQPAEVA